nr:SGNH/GDSL hydrolase family protein [Rhodothermaceae bacterium]
YENLLANNSVTSGLFGKDTQKPAGWVGIYETDAVKLRDDERLWELLPDVDIMFKNARLRTNRWGMRDQDYALTKPEGTYRVAVLGASYVMGAGVENNETFESIIEERLNEKVDTSNVTQYELLNFSVGGYGLIQQVTVSHEQVFDFEPDAILYIAQPGEVRRTIERFLPAIMNNHTIRSPELKAILEKSGITDGMKRAEARDRLYQLDEELVQWGYKQIADLATEHNAETFIAYLPNTARQFEDGEIGYLNDLVHSMGYKTVSLEGVYDSHSLESLQIAPWDLHPNPMGHKLIADKLFEKLFHTGAISDRPAPHLSQTALK